MSNLDNEQNPVNWLLGQPVHATEIGGERYIPEQTLSEKIDSMLASANKDVPEARRVHKRTAMDVVERSLYKTLGVSDLHQRVFAATRELDDYLNMAINGHQPVVAGGHTDLLPIGHPLSTNPAEVSLRTKALSESEWVSADPRISEEFRPLVASIYLTSPGSVEHNFLVARLESADIKDVPKDVVLAVTAAGSPFGGGNSFLERSARAKLQRRDRLGRFAFMGGGARAFIRDLKGFIHSVMGRFVGTGTDSDTFDVEFIDDPLMGTGIYRMSTKSVAGVKAYIRNIGNLLQMSKPKSADYARGYAIDANKLQKIDAPNGWTVDTQPITKGAAHKKQFLSNDGYALRQYDSTASIPSFDERVEEGVEVKGLGKGGAIDPKYPVYELFTNPSGGYDKEKWDSDANRFIGYYQSWGDIQAAAQKADKKAYKAVDSKQERKMWGDAPDGDFPKTFEQVDPATDGTPFSTYRSKNNATGDGGYTVKRFQPEKHDAVKEDMERNISAGAEFQGFTSGSKDIDLDEPIFEVTRQPAPWEKNVKPEIIGYAQDWEDVQSMAEASEMSMPRMGENPRREKVRKFKKDSGLDYINEDEVVTPEDFKQGEDGRIYYTPADENAPRARITEDYRGNYVTEVYDNASDQKKLKTSATRTSTSKEEAIKDAAEYLSEENNIKAPSPTERQAKIDKERRGLMMFKPENQDENIPDSEEKKPVATLPERAPAPQSPPLPALGESEFLDSKPAKTKAIPTFISPQVFEDGKIFDYKSRDFGKGFVPANYGEERGFMPTPEQSREFDEWLKGWQEGDKQVKKRISDRMAEKYGDKFAERFIELNGLINTKSQSIGELRKWAFTDWHENKNGAGEIKQNIITKIRREVQSGQIKIPKDSITREEGIQRIINAEFDRYLNENWMSLADIRSRVEAGDQNSKESQLLQGGLRAQEELKTLREEFDRLEADLSIFSQQEYRRFMEESGVPMYDGDGSEVFEFSTKLTDEKMEGNFLGFNVKSRKKQREQGEDAGARKAAEEATRQALKRYPKWMVDALTEMAKKTPSGKIQIELDYGHHNDGGYGRGFFNVIGGDIHIRISANNYNNHGLLQYEETAAHEIGHALQAVIPEIRLAEWSLLTGRTRRITQDGGVPIAYYESVIPGISDEYGILDAFRNAYQTRIYGSPHPLGYTEVFPMAQERMQGGGGFTITNPHIFDAIEAGDMTAEEALFGDNDTAMLLGLMIDGQDSELRLSDKQLELGAIQEREGFAKAKPPSPKVGMIDETENLSNQESAGKSAKSQEVLSRIADVDEPRITENKDYGTTDVFQKGVYMTPDGKEYKLYFRETRRDNGDGTYKILGGGVDITDGYNDIGDISYSEVSKVMNYKGEEVWDETSLPVWYSRNLYDVTKPFSTINYVEVVPEARRQGIATALLEYARKHSNAPIHHSWELLEDGKNFAKAVQSSNATMLEDFPEAPEIGLPDLYSGKSEKSKEVLSRITSEKEFKVEELATRSDGVRQTRKSINGTYLAPDGTTYTMRYKENVSFDENKNLSVPEIGRVDIRTDEDDFVGYIEWKDAFGSENEQGKMVWNKNRLSPELYEEVPEDSPFSYINHIVVDDEFQRQGIATAMLEFGRMHSTQPIYHSNIRTDDGKDFSRAVQTSKKGEEDFPELPKPVDPKDLTDDDVTDLITESPVTKNTLQPKRGRRSGIGSLARHGYRDPNLGGYKPLFDADGDVVHKKLYDRARDLGLSDKEADKLAIAQATQVRDFIQRKNDKSRMAHLVQNAITPPEGASETVVKERERWARRWENNTDTVTQRLSSALATGNVVEPIDKDKLLKIINSDEKFTGRGFLADDFSTGKTLIQTDFVAPNSTNQNMRSILSVRNEKHALKAKVVFKESVRDRTKYTVGDSFESGSIPQPLNSRDEEAMTMAGLMGNNNGAFISMTGMGAPNSKDAQVETKTDGDLGINDVKAIYVSGEDAVKEVREALGDSHQNIDVIDVDHVEPFPENGKISFLMSPQSGFKYSPKELEQDIPDLKPEDNKRPISSKVAAVRKRLSTDEEPQIVETEKRSYGDTIEHIKARGSYMTPNGDIIDLFFERKKTIDRDGNLFSDGTSITAFDDNYNLIGVLEVSMAEYDYDDNGKQIFSLDGVDRVSHPEFNDMTTIDTPISGIAWISVEEELQRQGIGTALLEFARDNYPQPIYHSDNLSPDGRKYSLAVKKSENAEEDIPDATPAPARKPIPALVEDKDPEPEATAEAVEKAKVVREKAEQVEPKITEDVSSVAQALGGILKSLENRIKTRKSLARKIDKDAETVFDGDRGEAALRISDAIRYTMVTNTKKYVQTIKDARERFLALGYKVENEKNFWKSDEYKGYTFKLVSPEGYPVEFQIHTDESYEIKEDLHKLYEELRAIPKGEQIPRQRQLKVELKRLADLIPVPEDESLFDIGNLIGFDEDGKLTQLGKEFEPSKPKATPSTRVNSPSKSSEEDIPDAPTILDGMRERIASGNLSENAKQYADKFEGRLEWQNMPATKEKTFLEEKLNEHIDSAEFSIMMPASTFDEVLKEGKVRNIHQIAEKDRTDKKVGWTRDEWYMNRREAWEEITLGIPKDAKPEDRPIYAFVHEEGKSVWKDYQSYGSVRVILNRESVKKRSTYTTEDSLNYLQIPFRYGQATVDRGDLGVNQRNIKYYKDSDKPFSTNRWAGDGDDPRFIEAQISGGVTRDDFTGKIVVTLTTKYDGRVAQMPTSGQMDKWEAAGFEIFYQNPTNKEIMSRQEYNEMWNPAAKTQEEKDEKSEGRSAWLDLEVDRRERLNLPPLTQKQKSGILAGEIDVPLWEYYDEEGNKIAESKWR